MTHNLKNLAKKCDALLLVEVAAWLHMLGKFHECFLNGWHDLDIKIPPDLAASHPNLDHLLKDSWTGDTWKKFEISEFSADALSLFHFMKEHRNQNVAEGLLKLMWDAHGRVSGIEKGVLNRFASDQAGIVYPSTAFGTETNAIDLENLKDKRQYLYDFLQTNLESLKNSLGTSSSNWQEFRRKFISGIEDSGIENYFRHTVAETRRPLSDVSLFDQTAASVAFLKAALAQNLLVGWKEPPPVAAKTEDKYHWRFLRVGLNSLAFWGNSIRISDLLARRQLIVEALDIVKKVIEEDYPLGLEVYRDENGSLFIVPDVADLLDAKVDSEISLCEHLQEVANHRFDGEACWTLELSDRTRNTLRFGKLATSLLNKPTANPEWIKPYWNIEEKRDICPVCSLRPISNEKLKICNVCKERRTARAKEWTEKLSTTIWIDEVADTNSRLALIVGRFELESWLTGESFNSIVSSDPTSQIGKEPLGSKQHNFDYQQLLNDIQKALQKKPENKRQFVPKTLLNSLVKSDSRGVPKGHNHFQPFYDLQVTDSDLGENNLGEKRTTEEPWVLALAMMRQNPSFARLRRVWETTQRFWQKPLTDVPDAKLPKVKGRLIIESSSLTQFRLQRYGNYDLALGMTKLSVLHNNGKLITTDNLRYAAKQLGVKSEEYTSDEAAAEFVRSQLLNQQVPIEEPTGYGSPNKLQGKLNISNVTFDPTEYSPVIPILSEPRTFMALVPAEKSLEVIKAIKTKYEREMGKVRNRLPLHLGVVYFHRRTPLRSALDAGRQMLSYKSPDNQQLWQVLKPQCSLPTEKQESENGTKQFEKTIELTLTCKHNTITWSVPTNMGDGTTEDVWYPYVFLKTSDDSEVNGRQRAIKSQRPGTTKPCWLVHAADLKEGDQIYFTPSTFDFEFLDSTARRFEIYYDENGRRPRQTRPFYLEDLDRFDELWKILKNLETSQRHQVIHTIEATRETWHGQDEKNQSVDDPVFEQFVADTLANATWSKTPWLSITEEWREKLIDAGVRGELVDLAELHMEILKER